jgi:hypothetical protein
MLGRLFSPIGAKFAGKTFGALKRNSKLAGNPYHNLLTNTALVGGLTFITAPQESKVRDTATAIAGGYLFSGFGWWGQFIGGTAFSMALGAGEYTKHVGGLIRGSGQARMMASVPFSASPQGMDLAYASFQNTQQEMNKNYGLVGSEATIMASRYLSR